MLQPVRRFALRVLLLHAALLLLVLVVVGAAARQVYESARQQAIAQEARRQELFATATAQGIESYYQSILANLDLLRRSEETPASTQPAAPDTQPELAPPPTPLRRDLEPRTGPGADRSVTGLSLIMWRQLQGRVSHLLVVNRDADNAHGFGPKGPVWRVQLPPDIFQWCRTCQRPDISDQQVFDGQLGNYLAVPSLASNQVLLAFIPIGPVQQQFLAPLRRQGLLGAFLADSSGRIIALHRAEGAATQGAAPGFNVLATLRETPAVEVLERLLSDDRPDSGAELTTTRVGRMTLPPRVMGAAPIMLVNGHYWKLVVSSPLSGIDDILARLTGRMLFWGLVVALCVTVILVSTATQLIRSRMKLERQRHELLQQELAQARKIQLAWLPAPDTPLHGLAVAAANLPASHISGDFYNYIPLGDGRVAVLIGDVTGHGMSAAFLMATTQLLVRDALQRTANPAHCLARVNRQLCAQVFQGQFVTMLLMVIDPATGTAQAASAGHPGPLLRSGDDWQPLHVESDLILGVEADTTYSAHQVHLPAGALLVLYTDGVVEAPSAHGEQFTEARLREALRHTRSPQDVVDAALAAIRSHAGTPQLADDVTLVVVQLIATHEPAVLAQPAEA